MNIDDIKQIAQKTGVNPYKLLGTYYFNNNKRKDAILNFEKYIKDFPTDSIVLGILAYLYDNIYFDTLENNCLEKAIDYAKKSYELNKSNPQNTINLAKMYKDIGNYEKALSLWKEIPKENLSTDNKYSYALLNLKCGNFKEYYKYYEERTKLNLTGFKYPIIQKPQWRGENISNATLLVHYEMGFGDTIMFSRYLKDLYKIAKKVIFIVPEGLENLYKYNNFNCEIYTDISHAGDFDYYVYLMTLPEILGVTSDNLLYTNKYLNVEHEKVQNFKSKYFANNEFKIGIKYQGDMTGAMSRNVKTSEITNFINRIKNAKIYSFQFDNDISGVTNLKEMVTDFYDTSAIIENMDLIISTDNVILNLAGALGKKTFGLFNYAPEDRWFDLNGNDVKWYNSITPYCQEELNNWNKPLNKILEELNS